MRFIKSKCSRCEDRCSKARGSHGKLPNGLNGGGCKNCDCSKFTRKHRPVRKSRRAA